jgi:hypothetical protein
MARPDSDAQDLWASQLGQSVRIYRHRIADLDGELFGCGCEHVILPLLQP